MYSPDHSLGIVTQFTTKAYPIGQVWGGFRIYDTTHEDEIYAALHDFVPHGPRDPKAAIIHTNSIAAGNTKSHILIFFYDGPTPPTTGPFADFINIPPLIDQTGTQSYASLVSVSLQLISKP
jgi:hypothetical protein